MQIQFSPLLSSPYSSSSVGASPATSVGQRASLPTQRQGISASNVVKRLLAVLENLKPVRFSEDHRTLILNMFPAEQQASILPLLKALRHEPISVVGADEKNKPTYLCIPLFQVITHHDALDLVSKQRQLESKLATFLENFNFSNVGGRIDNINHEKLILRIDLKDQTSEQIQSILTHLPAIIKGKKKPSP
jgi:hypothetical protein